MIPAGHIRYGIGAAALAGAALLVGSFALGFGQVQLSIGEVLAALAGRATDPVADQIVTDIRLPRILAATIGGAALGVAGLLMQALFRNPMADAWSLGLVAGGQLGVALTVTAAAFAGPTALAFVTEFSGIAGTVAAMAGVAVAALAMAALARRIGRITLLVVGLMLGFTAQGLVSILLHFANRVGGRVFSGWNDGTFANMTNSDLPEFALPIAMGLGLAVYCAKPLTTLLLGEVYAESLGTNLVRLRRLTLLAVVLLVAPVTAYCGPVTFIGLIVPHFARAIAGSGRLLPAIPLAALAGALLASAADFVVHLPWDQHFLHLNAVLAIVGAPAVIAVLLYSRALRAER
jgi:iron complex transport system permease protein